MLPNTTDLQNTSFPLGPNLEAYNEEFSAWDRHAWMLANVVVAALFMVVAYRYHFLWHQVMQANRAAYEKMFNECGEGLAVVKMLVPSLLVDDYEFKGIKRPEMTISLRFEDLGLVLKNGSSVLDGVTGQFDYGKLIAVMGPSGAGKTTFMNVLCGKGTYGKMEGKVFINDEERSIFDFKSVMGFVPQEDIVYEKLTVRENLRFSAMLRGDRKRSLHEVRDVVTDVLSVLQIGHIQMSVVGGVEERGISGGQRKRVNIGLELVACPTLLFLDEPTSGLDSTSSLTIIHSLKKMTELGITIIMVIHQPRYSLFTLFDEVLLLGRGGKTVFEGKSDHAKPYFEYLGYAMPENENPADWFMDVLSGEVPNSEGISKHDTQALFKAWKEKGREFLETMIAPRLSNKRSLQVKRVNTQATCRSWETEDDDRLIENSLMEAWEQASCTNFVSKQDLGRLLSAMSSSDKKFDENDAIITEFWDALVHASPELKGDIDTISYAELVDFVKSKVAQIRNERRSQPVELDRGRADCVADRLDGAVEGVFDVAIGLAAAPLQIGLRVAGASDKNVASHDVKSFKPRKIRGRASQFIIIARRRLIQVYRNSFRRAIDVFVLLAAAALLGIMHQDKSKDPNNAILAHLALAMLISVNCLSCFAGDRPMFWRERSHGLDGIAFCLGRMTIDGLDILLQATVFPTMYYLIAQPEIPFQYFLFPFYLLAYACSGWGYLISVLVPPQNATMTLAILMLILNGAIGAPTEMDGFIDGGFMEMLLMVIPVRWSLQMFTCKWVSLRPHPQDEAAELAQIYMRSWFDFGQGFKDRPQSLQLHEDIMESNYMGSSVLVLIILGTLLRCLSTVVLCYRNRDKQV